MSRSFRLPLFPLLLLAGFGACRGSAPESIPAVWSAPTHAIPVAQMQGKLGGCAAGDLTSDPGDELLAVGSDGSVWLAWHTETGWQSAAIAQLDGEAIGVAVVPAPENQTAFVTVGKLEGDEETPGPGAAWLFRRPSRTKAPAAVGWNKELLRREEQLIHAVAADDRGFVIGGYAGAVHRYEPSGEGFASAPVSGVSAPIKGLALDHDQVAIACADGQLFEAQFAGGSWKTRLLWRFPEALARVDLWQGSVAVSSNDGGLYVVDPRSQGDALVYSSDDRLRGAVFLEAPPTGLDPSWYLATAGYDGRVHLIPRSGPKGAGVHLRVDEGRLHHLAPARVADDAGRIVPALVTSGYSGRLLLLPFEARAGKP
ncbi:MAG: hypothetical protein R3F17_13130 [Planctomycetota bacterium]